MKKTDTPELNRIRELRDAMTGDVAPITNEHIYECPQPYIEWLIDFLILTHIARRGKLLHIDTICKKLKRYGSDGIVAINTFDTIILAGLNQEFNLELKKRNFNANFMCIDTYNYLYQKALDDNISNKRLKHINNFAKKFHNSIVYADNVSYGPNTLAHRGKPKGYRIPTKRHSFRQQQQNFRLQQEIIHSKQTQQELPF
ncbi:MAG: hypothetical protein IJS34_02000 [Alphaproteobacteria bacterium]|nr:hypothetical protein [Alphaproteobacteria bacterium]